MDEILEQALRYEEEGKYNECEELYVKALDEYPEDKALLSYFAIFLFKKGDYERALDFFVKSYNHPNQLESTRDDLLNHILVAYYQPNAEILKKMYINNVDRLVAYEHGYISSFVDFEDLSYLCIPRNDSEYYIWDKRTQYFKELLVMDKIMTSYEVASNDCVVAVDVFDLKKLESVTEQTRDLAWLDNIKIPIYVIWNDNEKLQQYLQLVDYTTLIDLKRLVFFSGHSETSEFATFFKDHQAIYPEKLIGDQQYFGEIIAVLQQMGNWRAQDIKKKIVNINKEAEKYDKKYYKRLFSGSVDKIRILFYTCRFTTVLQYANRDFMQACRDFGIQCEVLIEKSDIHRVYSDTVLVDKINEFKPNIIFFIHYFKSDFKTIPSNIMSISWLQDPNYKFTSRQHAEQFGWNDFALPLTQRWYEDMIKTGYHKSRLAIQKIPIDEKTFCEKELSPKDRDFYGADIGFPGNYQTPEKELAQLIVAYTNGITDIEQKKRMTNVLISTYDNLRSRIVNEELIYSADQCEIVINEFAALLDIKIELPMIKEMAKKFYIPVCYNLHRKHTLKWLIDYGFQVKLWGSGWDTDPDLKNNWMGTLAHGEELAKMYSCTKIVPGAFSEYTSHFRSWESTSCGALYMARYIPPEFDILDIRESFTENEQFVFYYDKKDLIEKVKYYLMNEEERKRIAQSGRQAVLQEMIYANAARKALQLIKENVVGK